MGDDLSTGAKIGIGLVILCFLIAIVLALLMVVKNITNSGANQMESGLNQMMQTTYDDYDQKVVTGTKVKSALKLFQNEAMGILVNSHYSGNDDTTYNYGLLLSVDPSGAGSTKSSTKGTEAGASAGDTYKLTAPTVRPDQASYWGSIPDRVEYNLNTKPLDASGTECYVRSNAKYVSYLIKDSTDTIVGIFFDLQT